MLKKRSGQTLLELVIASGVISISVIAALTLIIKTIDLARQSQQTVEAGNYAREGVEVVRMIRDSNWLDIDDNVQRCNALTVWDSDGTTSGTCPRLNGTYIATLDPTTGWSLVTCGASCATASKLLRINGYTTQSLTSLTGSSPTIFSRTITIQPGTEPVTIGSVTYTLQYLDVAVLVNWKTATRRVAMNQRLYNWR